MKNYERFRWFLAITTILSACVLEVSRGGFDFRIVAGLALIYGASVFLRDHFYSSETTFFDYDHREIARPNEDLIVFGSRIQNLASQSREREVLLDLAQTAQSRWKVYLAWFVMAGIAVWLHMRTHGVIFSETLGSVLIVSGIFFSPFLGQLLLPAYLALGLTGFALYRDREIMTVAMAALFFVSFLLTLIVYREIDADRANPKRVTSWQRPVKSAFLWAALFLAAFWVFDKLVPEPQAASGAMAVERPKLSRELANQMLKLQDRMSPGAPGAGDFKPPSGSGDLSKPNGTEAANPAEEPKSKSDPLDELPSRNQAGPQKSESGDPPKTPANGAQTTNPADESSPTGKSRESSDQENKIDEGDAKDRGEPSLAKTPGAQSPGNQAPGTAAPGSTSPGEGPPGQGRPSGSPSGAESPTAKASSQETNQKTNQKTNSENRTPPKDRESRLKELEKKIELPMEITKGVLVIVGLVVALLMLAKYFSSGKEDPEKEIKVQQISKKQRERLQTILQQIHAKGLSAHDEVIETYNALMAVFQAGEHRREEWLPPEEFSNQIARALPSLRKPFDEITGRFSRTLYGKKSVSESELMAYRENVMRILKFFQVAV